MAGKNTLLLFSKVPQPGLVKTRLTTLKDGFLEPETASWLYHCMLFDVVEICMAAFRILKAEEITKNTTDAASDRTDSLANDVLDEYELVISTTPPENVAIMQKLFEDAGTWPMPITFIADEGASFDEHYNHAFAQCFEMGASRILSMGADMPALTVRDVIDGFKALKKLDESPNGGIVLAPDQEMGVSVIGWNAKTEFDHSGVFYNKQGMTVLPAYIQKAQQLALPALYLAPIPDVDTMADLFHTITLVEALNYCSQFDGNTPPWRTWNALQEMGYSEILVPPNDLLDPRGHIDHAPDSA